MVSSIKKFIRSPAGRRFVAYIVPVIAGWAVRKLQGRSTQKARRKK